MKKILLCLIWMSCQLCIGNWQLGIADCMAQKHTSVARQFDGSMPYYHLLDRVVIEGGEELNAYKLSLYKSVTVKENAFTPKELAQQAFKDMEHDVEEAAKNALLKEVGHKQGKLYYAFLMLRDCYIFYQNASLRKDGKREATIVYMEGQKNSSMSMSELKRMFKKK
ncbi:MAG: hypothetical protein IKN83_09180 [Bacteroidaceae bacterium]|nr:hypothetical protein [Bacteroidaceae bacterium]